jgi:prepilin-type N-terminal cleavage/methylation domain-containing protein
MTHPSLIEKKSQAGFTLVELAIVMIIIGLLIGGVLKGQELIGNAQIAATSAQVKAYDTATTTFNDIYDGLPGDLTTPAVRIPNCAAAPCAVVGDGSNTIGGVPGAAQVAASENVTFWVQLNAADLLTGIEPNQGLVIGGVYPEAEANGGFQMGYHPGGARGNNASAFRGHYVVIAAAPAAGAAGTALTASQAARLDRKLDDGTSDTGSVFADGNTCDAAAGVYNEAVQGSTCDLFFRIQ